MVSESRSERIADRLNRELSMLFMQEISDPRLEGLSITGVEVDRELAYADVYVSALDGDGRKQDIMKALKRAKGFIRSQLAVSVSNLRTFPEIRYHWDSVPERVTRMDEIFAELEEEEGFKDLDE